MWPPSLAQSPCGTVLEGVGGDYLEGRILMMETQAEPGG